MTIEMIDGRSTIHACNCKDATPCMNDCTCNVNKVSEIIDADGENLATLKVMRDEVQAKMWDLKEASAAALSRALAPWREEDARLERKLEEYRRPACFGGVECSDADYERCPSATVKACQMQCRGRA